MTTTKDDMRIGFYDLKREVFDAVDANPYIQGVDALAVADFVLNHLSQRGLLQGNIDQEILIALKAAQCAFYAPRDSVIFNAAESAIEKAIKKAENKGE